MTSPSPAPLLIPDAMQMTVNLVSAGQPAAVVMGIKGPVSSLTPTFAAAARDAWWAAFRPLMASSVSITGVTLRYCGDKTYAPVETGAPSTTAGGAAAASGLQAACTLIKWSTSRGGRSGKGRTFLPGLMASAVGTDGRTYIGTYPATVQNAINAYLQSSAFTAGVGIPAILSFTLGEAFSIQSGALAPIVGVQRRRMRA